MKSALLWVIIPGIIAISSTTPRKTENQTPVKSGTYIGWRTATGSDALTYKIEFTITTPSNVVADVKVYNSSCLQNTISSWSGTVSFHTPGYYVNNGFSITLSNPSGVTLAPEGYLTDGSPCNESLQ